MNTAYDTRGADPRSDAREGVWRPRSRRL